MCASSELKKSVDPGSIIPLALNSFTEASWHDFTSNGLPRAMNSLEPREKLIISSTFEGTDQSITRTFTLSRQFLFLRSLSQRHWAPQARLALGTLGLPEASAWKSLGSALGAAHLDTRARAGTCGCYDGHRHTDAVSVSSLALTLSSKRWRVRAGERAGQPVTTLAAPEALRRTNRPRHRNNVAKIAVGALPSPITPAPPSHVRNL